MDGNKQTLGRDVAEVQRLALMRGRAKVCVNVLRKDVMFKNLSKVVASGRLIVSFDGMANVAIPYNGWAKKKFYER